MNILLHIRNRSIGHLDHVFTDTPAWNDALENNIEAFIREIPAEILARVCQNWTKRMDHLKRSRGKHLHEIIFKH